MSSLVALAHCSSSTGVGTRHRADSPPCAIAARASLGDLMASAGPWEGESTEELIRILREGRDAGGSAEPPESL